MRQIYLQTAWFDFSVLYETENFPLYGKKQMFLSIRKGINRFLKFIDLLLYFPFVKNFLSI